MRRLDYLYLDIEHRALEKNVPTSLILRHLYRDYSKLLLYQLHTFSLISANPVLNIG